jgi:glycosyltransferase involved in cell wall biosynthesis
MSNLKKKSVLIIGLDSASSRIGGVSRVVMELSNYLTDMGSKFNLIENSIITQSNHGFLRLLNLIKRYYVITKKIFKVRNETNYIFGHFPSHTLLAVIITRQRCFSYFHGPWAAESTISENKKYRSRNSIKFRIERSVYKKSILIFCASTNFAKILNIDYGIPWNRIVVVGLGVDNKKFSFVSSEFARETLGLEKNKTVIVSVRRLTKRMGLDFLIEAMKHIDKFPYELHIIGRGPEEDYLRSLIVSLRLQDSIFIHTDITDEKLKFWYCAADLTVIPSLDLKGFGLVVLESLSCGTPVLASNIGGMGELVSEWDSRFLFEAGNLSDFISKLSLTLQITSAEKLRLVNANLEFAKKKSWSSIFDVIFRRISETTNFLFISHSSIHSGAEVSLLNLIQKLNSNRNIDVILWNRGWLSKKLSEIQGVSIQYTSSRSKNGERLTRNISIRNMSNVFIMMLRLNYRLFKTNKSKIIFINTRPTLFMLLPFLYISQKRFIYWSHDLVMNKKVQSGSDKFLRLIFKICKKGIILVNSDYIYLNLSDLDIDRMEILYPIFDTSIMLNIGKKHEIETIVIGINSRIDVGKGQEVVLRAFKKFNAIYPNSRLEILGGAMFGEIEYLDKLHQLTRTFDYPDKVIFHGMHDKPLEIMKSWDISVHGAIYPEPFGRNIIESMMLGIPVVVPSIGGALELVQKYGGGLLYEAGDPESLFDSLILITENDEIKKKILTNLDNFLVKFDKSQSEKIELLLDL